MTEYIKKLIAREYVCENEETHTYPAGYKYTYLVDPETGKHYQPIPGWIINGERLENLFTEVEPR